MNGNIPASALTPEAEGSRSRANASLSCRYSTPISAASVYLHRAQCQALADADVDPGAHWSNQRPPAVSRSKRAMSFLTTMLRLAYLASSSPAASKTAPGGKPIGLGPVVCHGRIVQEGLSGFARTVRPSMSSKTLRRTQIRGRPCLPGVRSIRRCRVDSRSF